MKKNVIIAGAIAAVVGISLTACGKNPNTDWFVTFDNNIKEFDTSLYYGNVETMRGADPSLIYVEEKAGDDDSGYYYAYVTAVSTINAWRTKDMTNWQYLGAVFRPDLDKHWAYSNFWAPAVIYDDDDQTYYMYYSATNKNINEYSTHYVSLAKSNSPMGPFEEVGGSDKPLIDFAKIPKENRWYEFHGDDSVYADGYFSAIDAEPFIDPVSSDKYLLFTHDKGAGYTSSSTYIMKMHDWATPDYSSVECISVCGYTIVGGSERIDEGTVNEGPFMFYRDGLYYLTFSVNMYTESSYQVRQAVGTSPTGPFRKIAVEDGGAVVTTDGLGIYTNSSGHHSFIWVGDELYISYHTFLNDSDISEARKIRFDKVSFVVNGEGIPVLYANGPTVTMQPLPSLISGYSDVSGDAQISATNLKNGSDTYWLNDGTLSIHENGIVNECLFNEGKSTVSLAWRDYVTAKSVMVYNSRLYNTSFTHIDNIKLWYRKDGKEGVIETGELKYNYDIYAAVDYKCIFSGVAVSIEFADLEINKMEITISSSKGGNGFGVSEIKVLARR